MHDRNRVKERKVESQSKLEFCYQKRKNHWEIGIQLSRVNAWTKGENWRGNKKSRKKKLLFEFKLLRWLFEIRFKRFEQFYLLSFFPVHSCFSFMSSPSSSLSSSSSVSSSSSPTRQEGKESDRSRREEKAFRLQQQARQQILNELAAVDKQCVEFQQQVFLFSHSSSFLSCGLSFFLFLSVLDSLVCSFCLPCVSLQGYYLGALDQLERGLLLRGRLFPPSSPALLQAVDNAVTAYNSVAMIFLAQGLFRFTRLFNLHSVSSSGFFLFSSASVRFPFAFLLFFASWPAEVIFPIRLVFVSFLISCCLFFSSWSFFLSFHFSHLPSSPVLSVLFVLVYMSLFLLLWSLSWSCIITSILISVVSEQHSVSLSLLHKAQSLCLEFPSLLPLRIQTLNNLACCLRRFDLVCDCVPDYICRWRIIISSSWAQTH